MMVKNLPVMLDTWVEKIPWRREWQPTPVVLPGEFHGERSLAGYSLWGGKESDMTERLNNNKNVLRVCCCYFYVDRYSIDPVAFFERQISLVELTLYPCQKLVDHEVGFKFLLHSIDLYIHIFL